MNPGAYDYGESRMPRAGDELLPALGLCDVAVVYKTDRDSSNDNLKVGIGLQLYFLVYPLILVHPRTKIRGNKI